jgi:hypothetical protein
MPPSKIIIIADETLISTELADRLARRGYAIIDRTPAKSVAS